MAGTCNFTVFAGEDFDRTLTWSASSVPVSQGGTPVDLTGYTAALAMADRAAFVTTVSNGNGLVTLGGAAGTIRIQMTATSLYRFSSSRQAIAYRLHVTAPSGEARVLLAGNFRVVL